MNLVTGATGFIGRHVAERLAAAGEPTRVLCREHSVAKLPAALRERVEVVHGDLLDRDSLADALRGVVRVFHCAGQVADWGPAAGFRAINVDGTRALLDLAAAAGVTRFVHLSSIAAFGTPSPAAFDDASPYGTGRDSYSRTKAEGDALALAYRAPGLGVTVLRPAVVYGIGGTWLEEPLRMIARGRMFLLGDGSGTCHPCYVENLVDAALLAARHPRAIGRAYIVADDDPITFRDYFDAIAQLAGMPPIERSIPLPIARAVATAGELVARIAGRRARPLLTHTAIAMVATRSRMSMQRIRDELGYVPRYTFRAAMAELAHALAHRCTKVAHVEP